MFVRFKVPLDLFVYGSSPSLLTPRTIFQHKIGRHVYPVQQQFQLQSPPLFLEQVPPERRHFSQISALVLTITDRDNCLQELFEAGNRANLAGVGVGLANRMINAIRNFGIVPHLPAFRAPRDPDNMLRRWQVETSEDGELWQRLIEPGGTLGGTLLGLFSHVPPIAELNANQWSPIEEAIQDDIVPGPEREFGTNALESVRLQNYRQAVIEAAVCLEIVVSQYLREYLRVVKGFSKNEIRALIGPKLDLYTRVNLILPLIMPASDYSPSLNAIRQVVGWRNQIMHHDGRLPSEVPDATVDESVRHVVVFAFVLALRRMQLVASPQLAQIASDLAASSGFPRPTISARGPHSVLALFPLFLTPTRSDEQLEAVVRELIVRLSLRDPRFVAERHLVVEFGRLAGEVARWEKGRLLRSLPARASALTSPPAPPSSGQ